MSILLSKYSYAVTAGRAILIGHTGMFVVIDPLSRSLSRASTSSLHNNRIRQKRLPSPHPSVIGSRLLFIALIIILLLIIEGSNTYLYLHSSLP